MLVLDFHKQLLEMAQLGQLDDIRDLPEAGVWKPVSKFSGGCRRSPESRKWLRTLSDREMASFAKAMAVLEDTVGSVGSCTALQWILDLSNNEGRNALDWILQNTKAYDYFSQGAASVEQLDILKADKVILSIERAEKESQRQAEDKIRIAAKATVNLSNAINRGDVKAVRALIEKGANKRAIAPDGTSLVEKAESMGRVDIMEILTGDKKTDATPWPPKE